MTILDNEVGVSISAAANASEAGLLPGAFTITRAGGTTSNLTVNFLVGGTATSGVDYAPLGNSIVIPAGAASTNLTVVPWDDALAEGTETIVITLTNGAGYTLLAPTNATILLLDDEFNLPPTVEITSPTVDTVYLVNAKNWLLLEATVTDDGQPNPPRALASAWTKVSGPGPVTFASTNTADSAVKFSSNGVYVLRLTASDTQLQTNQDLTVTVNPNVTSGISNFAPVIEIGSAQNIFWNSQAYLNATVTDDGKPNAIGYPSNTWSTASGPGAATFADEHDVSTTVSFSAPGSYVLRLTSDDGQVKVFDEMTVTVAEAQTISIRATNLFASEFGPVPGYFQITRVGPTNAALTVHCAFGGTAANGVDFGLLPTSMSIPAGASAAQFALTPITDNLPEGDETVIVTLQPDAAYELGSSISDSVTILDQPWDAWRFAHFSASELTNAAISGELADPEGDGVVNLLEYAGNLDPKIADATRTLTGTLEFFPATGHKHLVVSFTRRKAPTDLTYQVQVSNDWSTWSSGPDYVQELQPVQDDGNGVTETVRVRILNPADMPGFRFTRLKVTRP